MQIRDLASMYEFLVASRERFLKKFRYVGREAILTDRGATWGSMLGIFLHLLDVEESWLHAAQKPSPEPSSDLESHVLRDEDGSWEIDPTSFETFEQLEDYHQTVVTKTRRLLKALDGESLDEEFVLEGTGEQRKTRLEHILFHVFVDEVAHLGELDCLMWQRDVDPEWLSWLDLHKEPVT